MCLITCLLLYIVKTRTIGPFPGGVILHSYGGSAEIVPKLSELGGYFSFSVHNMYGNKQDKKVLKLVCCLNSIAISNQVLPLNV